jgi:hypothetical protein
LQTYSNPASIRSYHGILQDSMVTFQCLNM